MWNKIFVLEVLIAFLIYPKQQSFASTNQSAFIKTIGHIKESKKISAYCTANDLRLKWKKNIQLIEFQSCEESLDVIIRELPGILNDSPSCFVVVIKTNESDNNFEVKVRDVLKDEAARPMIVNFYNKFERTENFYIIDRSKTRIQTKKTLEYAKSFIEQVISFDYDVESSEFSERRSDMLKDAMTNNCPLCINFAQLVDYRFTWYLKIHDDQIEDLSCDTDCFRALLNLPYNFNFDCCYKDVYELLYSYYIELIKDSSSTASKIGDDYSMKEFLADNEIKLDLNGLTALAWKEDKHKVFEFLIRVDLPFPQNYLHDRENELSFGLIKNKFLKNLESFIEELENFHRNIRKGNLKRVKLFLNQNRHLVFARSMQNKSALKAAFDSNQLEIFAYLKSQGMSFGNFKEVGEYYKVKNKYKDSKRKQLRQFNRKFLTPAIEVDLITKLMQKTMFTHDHHIHDENDIRLVIRRSYEKIKLTAQEILEITAASNELQILFEFRNSDLIDFDPYVDDANGVAYYHYDFVIIAAKDLLSDDIDNRNYALGTISHELMHYTMHQLYHNSINPFDENDHARKEIITKIYKKYRKIKDEELLIKTAYKDEDDDDNYGELIARVPDVLFTYNDNQTHLNHVKTKFRDLFKFYDQYVLADMQEFIPTMYIREKVRELNNWLDLVDEIQNYNVEKAIDEEENADSDDDSENKVDIKKSINGKEEEDGDEEELSVVNDIVEYLNEDTKQRLKVFTSNNTKLILQKLYFKLKMSKTIAIYVSSSFTYYGNFEQVMLKIDTIHPSVPLIINCDRARKLKKIVKMMQSTTFRKVVAIADKDDFENKVSRKDLREWIEDSQF